jgi:hypothetical protein
MIMLRRLPLLLAAGLLPISLPAAGSQSAEPQASSKETPAGDATDKPEGDAAAEDKRVCRFVKLDASSRRKTKVCRTAEEWRELNNIR